MTFSFSAALLDSAMTYAQYRTLTDELLAANKTTGSQHAPDMIEYTRMNVQRMRRIDKTVLLPDVTAQLAQIATPQMWVVLTEAWCGDAAQNLPVLALMANQNPLIDLRLLLRDEHPAVMDAYLTNGGRSIPKLIVLRADDLTEMGTWGPRPAAAQDMVAEFKRSGSADYKAFAEQVHAWYAKDRTRSLQAEFVPLLAQWH